jgi:hypothetical protein
MRERVASFLKKSLRPIARHRFLLERARYLGESILTPQEGNDLIAERVHSRGMVVKIGGTEMKLVRVYLRRRDDSGICHNFGHYTRWAYISSGIYPPEPKTLSRFCRLYLETLSAIDLLAVWFNFGEAATRRRYAPQATLCALTSIEPFYHERPWTAQLAGKRVVVVSPFEKSIKAQYKRREKVWARKPAVLPEFDLRVVKCPQLAGIIDEPEYPDWFIALEALKQQLTAEPFDVAIIGAGAWSVPLAAHAKNLGAYAVHLGGGTQLLFGIMGARWESNQLIAALRNDSWTRPSAEERPEKYLLQEGGSYW